MKKLVNHLLYCLFALTVTFQGLAEAAQIYLDFSHTHETEQDVAQNDAAKKLAASEVIDCGVHTCSMCHLLSTNMGGVSYFSRTPIIFEYRFSESTHIAEGLIRPPRISLA